MCGPGRFPWVGCVGGPRGTFARLRGSDLLALGEACVAEVGEEILKIVAQAGDGFGVCFLPSVGEAACGATCLAPAGGVHDGAEAGLDGVLVGLVAAAQTGTLIECRSRRLRAPAYYHPLHTLQPKP